MKPFNLQEALAGKPVVTRHGIIVTKIYHIKEKDVNEYTVLAVINSNSFWFNKNGIYNPRFETGLDLFMATEKKTVWVNVYKDADSDCFGYYTDRAVDSEEKAKSNISSYRPDSVYIKTCPIEIEV